MSALASQITSLTIVYSTLYSVADHWKHQSSASLAFVRGIHRWPVNSPHKGPITRKMFPFDDVIMELLGIQFVTLVPALSQDLHKSGLFSDRRIPDVNPSLYLKHSIKSKQFLFWSLLICWSHVWWRLNTKYTHLPLVSALVQIMACRLFGAKPLSKPMLDYCQLNL